MNHFLIYLAFLRALILTNEVSAQSFTLHYDYSGNLLKKTIAGQGPSLQIVGPETLCPGDTLMWTALGGQDYLWSTGIGTPTLQVIPLASGQYSVTTTATNGCTAVKTKSFTLLPKPGLGYIQQTSPQGAPGPVTYTTTSIPNATYYWTATGGFFLSGQGTATVQVQWNAGGQAGLSVFAQSLQGCNSDTVTYTPGVEGEQYVPLNPGWNLASTYLAPLDYSAGTVFSELEQNGVLQKVKTIDKLYTPGIPVGNSLQSLEDGVGYWIRVNQPATWKITGAKLDPLANPILLKTGWNLIGYLPNHPLPVQDALASVIPQVKIVKNIFSSFDPSVLPILNTLKLMEPGQGYLVLMNAPATLVFPADNLTGPSDAAKSSKLGNDWRQLITAYPNSMTAYGLVTLNNLPVEAGKLILAKVGDEVRGAGTTVLHNGQSFVTLVLNGVAPEDISFQLVSDNENLTSSFRLTSAPGTNQEGFLPLAFGGISSTAEAGLMAFKSELFPNPTTGQCTMRIETSEPLNMQLRLTDIAGRTQNLLKEGRIDTAGAFLYTLDLFKLSLPLGVYFVEVRTNKGIQQHKLLVQQP